MEEEQKTDDQMDLFEVRMKKLEKLLNEPIYVSAICKDGKLKIQQVITESAFAEAQEGHDQEHKGSVFDAISERDNLGNQDYFG